MIEWSRKQQSFVLTCDNCEIPPITLPKISIYIWLREHGWKRSVRSDATEQTHVRHWCPNCTVPDDQTELKGAP